MTFNYFITIHNKEDLIREVVLGVIRSMGASSTLYPILDGCVDQSESIIDDLILQHPEKKIIKVYTNDVHELMAINGGLKLANQSGIGYNIVLQDDVILDDINLEDRITEIYKLFPNLGILSFRHGANLSRKLLFKTKYMFPIVDYIQNVNGHYVNKYTNLKLGHFVFREIAIKSPICIPFTVVQAAGIPDETYAPWDDINYCFKVSSLKFNNGVLAINFRSDVEWGTTRIKKSSNNVNDVQKKNIKLFLKENYSELKDSSIRKDYKMKDRKIFNIVSPKYQPVEIFQDFIKYYIEAIKVHLKETFYK